MRAARVSMVRAPDGSPVSCACSSGPNTSGSTETIRASSTPTRDSRYGRPPPTPSITGTRRIAAPRDPIGQVRRHRIEPVSRLQRLWAAPINRLVVDPDARPRRLRGTSQF